MVNLLIIYMDMDHDFVATKPYLKLRIFATLIDYGIYITLFCFYITLVGKETGPGTSTVTGLPALPLFLFWLVYFVGLEAIYGATPGHDVFKLKVTKVTGSKISFADAFKRRLCDPLDIFIWGLPAIICILKTDKHQRIGDLFADTIVVKRDAIIADKLVNTL
ncbi:putative RDD family membrane protein YckC [Mucilaginibacter gracilis]|uniref:Putative RDD family membrane protein YckC n=1 Tax=Mucilaginibacter gracilis TaxID=423350 RepID=A0A495J7S2_9SPHI|nr:RDD family protein [Mucilaginibacter gracilis]RKR85040.1 putative RDD family membrane protein YckC [Mucilaginibacter gracilis]